MQRALITLTLLFLLLSTQASWAALPAWLSGCGWSATPISTIQGQGDESPLINQTVTIEATVTALFLGPDQLNGFYVQEEPEDWDEHTDSSEGMFIYLGQNKPYVRVSDRVRITGVVKEYYGRTELSQPNRLVRCEIAAKPITPHLINNAHQDTSSAPIIHWEHFEGMLIQFTHPVTLISTDQYNRFGNITVSPFGRLIQPTQQAPPSPTATIRQQHQHSQLIDFDDGSTLRGRHLSNRFLLTKESKHPSQKGNPRVQRGDTLSPVTGVVDYAYKRYRLQPTLQAHLQPHRSTVKPKKAGHLRVATFNTHNFFNGHQPSKRFISKRGPRNWQAYLAHRTALVDTLYHLDADIYGLTELENDGYGPHSSIADLTEALSKATGKPFAFAQHGGQQLGSDEIRSAILYNTQKISSIGPALTIAGPPFDRLNRPPLLQSFSIDRGADIDQTLHIVVNHFKSKGGCPTKTLYPTKTSVYSKRNHDRGDGEGCWVEARQRAVTALLNWLNTVGLDARKEAIIVLGDLNAHYFESPLQQLRLNGFLDTIPAHLAHQTYTYNFQQFSGQLDHIFISQGMGSNMLQAETWNRFSDVIHPLAAKNKPPLFDHDPIYIDL